MAKNLKMAPEHPLTSPAQLEMLLAQDAEQELIFPLGKCLAASLKRNTPRQRDLPSSQTEVYVWITEIDAGLPLSGEGITLQQMFRGNEDVLEDLQNYITEIATSDVPELRNPLMEKVTAQFMYLMEKKSDFLSSVAAIYTSEVEHSVYNALKKETHYFSQHITAFHNLTYRQKFAEPESWYAKIVQISFRTADALLAGKISRWYQKNINLLDIHYLGWSIVESTVRESQEEFSADIQFFPNEDFTVRIEEISRFYGELSTQAGYLKQRIKRISGELAECFAFHGIAPKTYDLEGLERKLLDRKAEKL